MDRREALKGMLVATGSLVALPAWATSWTKDEIHESWLDAEQQNTLRAITDTIIPAANSIGAVTVGVDAFLQKLIATCYDKETQDNVRLQFESLEHSAQKAGEKSFAESPKALREELLLKFSQSEVKAEQDFFTLIKAETIRGFSTSKEVMTKHLNYKVAPGHYYGCVDVKA